jgi:hypothetical protein
VRQSRLIGLALCCAAALAAAQSASSKEMTLDEFRHYVDVLHVKQADERGVRAQMKAQANQFPIWWPADVTDEITAGVLQVDLAALNYPYVKNCVSSEDLGVLTALFATPEGQQYVAREAGGIVDQEGKGVDPRVARDAAIDNDTGMPLGALKRLSVAQQARVKVLFAGDAMDCMNSGFKKANVDVSDARAKIVRAIVVKDHAELVNAEKKYEAAHPASGK